MIKLAAAICVLAVLPNVFSGVAQQRKRNEIVKLLRHMKAHQPDTREMTTETPTTSTTTEVPDGTNSTIITDNNEGTNFTDNGNFTDVGPDFACDNGDLTYSIFVCDGDNDCGDCTDEPADMCDVPCVPGQWNHDDITCVNGNGPFPASYDCDGWNDCGDCSDETCEQHAQACEGTEEGENFAARGGYFRKRANIVSTKTRNNSNEKKRSEILAEKRENKRTTKNKAHLADKRHSKGPSTLQKKSIKGTAARRNALPTPAECMITIS